jgi:hypothetical protein
VHPGRAIALDELLTTLFRHGFNAFRAGVSFTSDVRIDGDRRDRAAFVKFARPPVSQAGPRSS